MRLNDKKNMRMYAGRTVFLVAMLLVCAVFIALQPGMQVYADDESDVTASVTVVSGTPESYGGEVASSNRVLFPSLSTGQPDGWGAMMLKDSWIVIELADTVVECTEITVWVAKVGNKPAMFTVLASADGQQWSDVGSRSCNSFRRFEAYSFDEHSFNGTFGTVNYIAIMLQKAEPSSNMLLDAVCAKGGGA
jgi:hypothetical protein